MIALLHTVTLLNAATRTSTATGGNWATGGTWVGGAVPATTDLAVIATTGANLVSLGANATCAGVTVNSGSIFSIGIRTLTVAGNINNSGTITLTTGTITQSANGDLTNSGTITFASGTSALTLRGSLINTGTLTLVNRPVTFTGSNTAASTVDGFITTGLVSTTRAAGTITFNGNINGAGFTMNGTGGSLNLGVGLNHTFTGAVTLTRGTLYGGSSNVNANQNATTAWARATAAIFTPQTGTITLGGTGAQSIGGTSATTFNNLTLAGAGLKTLTRVPTVNGILSMEGTATISAAATLGASSTIQYKGTSSKTIGVEFPNTFAGTGGVIIDQGAFVITLNANKTALNGDLHLVSGTLNLAALTMNRAAAGGTFSMASGTTLRIGGTNTLPSNYTTHSIDAGSTIEYYGTNQTVAALNSSQSYGNLQLSTSGTKTLPASALNIVGNFTTSTAGTLTATAGAALTVGGVFTLAASTTFTAGAFTHSIAGNFSNTGTFTAGTGTVILSGAAQTILGTSTTTFNNLTLAGSSLKTFTTRPNVNGILSMEGTATASTYPTLGAASTIQYKGTTSRTIDVEFPNTFAGTGGVIIDQGAANTITLNANKTALNGHLNILTGTLDLSSFTMNRAAAGGTLTLASGTTLRIGGTNTFPTNYTTHSINSGSTVDYDGTSQTVANLNSSQGYGNLLLNGSGTKTLPASVLTIFGDFENNGVILSTTGNTLTFSGTAPQTLGGTTTSTFNNLTLNNASGVMLNTNQTVNGILDLTNGLLNTGINTITVGCSGSIANASAAKYVNGKLALIYCSAGSRVFPIGKGGNYRPLTLNYTALTGTSTVTAEQIESTLPGSIPSDIDIFSSRYWQLSQTGGSSYSYNLTLDGTGWSPTSYLKMLKGDGSTNVHNAVTTPNYTNSTAFNSFGNFGLGQLNCVTWLGTTNDWFTGSNWTSETPPTSTDDIRIPSSVSFYPSISGSSPGNDISIASAGKLQVLAGASLSLESGPLLTFQSGATATTGSGSKIVLKSDARYLNLSSSTPTLEVQRQLTGTKGWRMLASPVATTISDMFKAPLVTQGYTDPLYADLQPNLMWWDETDPGTTLQSWRKPVNLTDNIIEGKGYFHYCFNGAEMQTALGVNTGIFYPDVLPTTMSATGIEHFNGSGNFNYTLTYSSKSSQTPAAGNNYTYLDQNALDEGWNLIGNPTASYLDWDALAAWTKTNIDDVIYVWDPSTLNYKSWNGTTGLLGNGVIPPFQAFWIHASATSPALSFSNNAKTSLTGTFLRSAEVNETFSIPITLTVGDLQTTSFISFSKNGVTGPDRWDGYRLEPMSDSRLDLYTLSSSEFVSPLVINNLPLPEDDIVSIPLYCDAKIAGSGQKNNFTLKWELPANWPSEWKINIQDNKTEETLSMNEHSNYSFSSDNNISLSASLSQLPLPQKLIQHGNSMNLLRSSSSLPPFSIILSKGADINFLAPKPKLMGNLPNPFKSETTIRFSLPQKAKASVEVYSAQGLKIAILADDIFSAGITEVQWNATRIPPGIYFIRFKSGESVETKKAILIN